MRHGFVQTENGSWYEASRIVAVHPRDCTEEELRYIEPTYWATIELEVPDTTSVLPRHGVSWAARRDPTLGTWDSAAERDTAIIEFLRKVTFVLNGDGKRG